MTMSDTSTKINVEEGVSDFTSLAIFVGAYFILFVVAMSMFEFAVYFEMNRLFAPRSYARPIEIIKNQLKRRPYCIQWIPWVLSLPYSEMLEGVRGTGTRNRGWSGSRLRCNLDGVILIKFCVVCLKVSVLATFLCIVVILPVNYTAECNSEAYSDITEGEAICENITDLNSFGRTTYANIPSMYLGANTTWYSHNAFILPFKNESADTTFRMIAILLVAFVIYTYTCVLIWEEWIQNLALRRVYYLEFNHYKNRKDELERLENLDYPEGANITDRPVFVPHPELRDTVPNIGLYSVLFRLPGIQIDSDSCASDSNVGHQLQIAIEFFDKVVPNQPGYSSSVAALTILPDVKRLSQAWKSWFKCATKVRRLKFIRQRLKQARIDMDRNQIDAKNNNINNGCNGNYAAEFDESRIPTKDFLASRGKLDTVNERSFRSELFTSEGENIFDANGGSKDGGNVEIINDASLHCEVLIPGSQNTCTTDDNLEHEIDPSQSSRRMACVRTHINNCSNLATAELNEESNMEMFLDDDEIEQMTVYYREFARSSATCGPNGCDEYSILKADASTLEDLEREAAEEVHFAIKELRQARIEIRSDKKPEKASFRHVDEELRVENYHSEDAGNDQEDVSDSKEGLNGCPTKSYLWEEAEKLVGNEQYFYRRGGEVRKRTLSSGRLDNPFTVSTKSRRVIGNAIPSGVLSRIIKSESYAVVTFTSRQAAIAARQCLADGSGLEGWREIDKIPIPPLADAVPWNICDCRGCCRPVTISLPREQKGYRKKVLVVIMIVFTVLWTYPYVILLNATTPDKIAEILVHNPILAEQSAVISMMTKSLTMMGFFAVLPQIFKALSNFGSGATSIQEAERYALFYFWWFMVVFAFGSVTLGNSIIAAFVDGDVNVTTFQQILFNLANAVPIATASFWIGWILQQTLMVLPFMYFLQFNNFLFTALQWDCCARATAGGGPGGVVPYRIYVNVGIIFLCVVALAPLNPMVAPFAMSCLSFVVPMLKWSHIFVYRPIFDAGGMRWPILSDLMMTAIFGSQVVLTISFALKRGYVVAIVAGLSIIPTWTFKSTCKDTFEQSYSDAGLLQTSELDGWNIEDDTSMADREKYRKWIVDCHKASYVPICVNAEDNFLTSEPAVVISTERDLDADVDFFQHNDPIVHVESQDSSDQNRDSGLLPSGRPRTATHDSFNSFQQNSTQRGALFRRVSGLSRRSDTIADIDDDNKKE